MSCRLTQAILLLSLWLNLTPLHADTDWALTGYSTVLTEDPIEYVVSGLADYEPDFQLAALALSQQIPAADSRYDLEWEGQLVKHVSGQDHHELNGLFALRWYPLPWDLIIRSSAAVGLGLSYASNTPKFEQANHDKASRLLAYILLELEFQPADWGRWSWVVRSHHRSGAYGTFSGVSGASNSLGLGIKFRF